MYLEMLQQRYGAGFEKSSAALAGRMLRSLGRGMANPKLHSSIVTGLQGFGRAVHRVGSKLLHNPSTKLGFNVGGAAGLGTGALAGATGYGLYRTLSGPKQDTTDPQQSNPETPFSDAHKRMLDFSKYTLITNPTQGSSFNSTGY